MARVWLCVLGLLLTQARGELGQDGRPGYKEPSVPTATCPGLRLDGADSAEALLGQRQSSSIGLGEGEEVPAGQGEILQEAIRQRAGRWPHISNATWFFIAAILTFFLGFFICFSRWLLHQEEPEQPEEGGNITPPLAGSPLLKTVCENARKEEEGRAVTSVDDVPPPIEEETTMV